jgi:hypothetical protein
MSTFAEKAKDILPQTPGLGKSKQLQGGPGDQGGPAPSPSGGISFGDMGNMCGPQFGEGGGMTLAQMGVVPRSWDCRHAPVGLA